MSSSANGSKMKESSEAKEKKRRRALKKTSTSVVESPQSQSSSPDSKKSRVTASDNKQSARAIFYHEENTVMEREPQADLGLHHGACSELRDVMSKIKHLKDTYETVGEEKQTEIAEKIDELRIHGMMQFTTLRKLNRLAHFRCKRVRDNTTQAKQKIDQHQLQLQNLLYEVMHLQKEINKCLDFKSKDEEIELVDLEEFYREAPESISKASITKMDPHQQTLARLDWELQQRKRQSEQLHDAEGHKEALSLNIRTKKEHLESLQPKLATILAATKPVQDYLGMPFDEVREQHRTATYLPRALYVLYMQASAYKDACDKNLEVNIVGDTDVARSFQTAITDIEEDSGDSEAEEQEKPSEKRRRRNTTDDRESQRKQKLLSRHPLSVDIKITCHNDSTVLLSFYYLMALEIVTVNVKLTTPPETNGSIVVCAGDLVSSETLLRCLYPGDSGEDTPNPSNKYALQRLGMGKFSQYIPEVGLPYQWAQWLCGLKFLKLAETSTATTSKADLSVSACHMDGTIKRVRQRVRARLSLQKQLAALEKCSVMVSSDYQSMFPLKLSSRLSSWKRSTYEDFSSLPYCQPAINAGMAQPSDMFFTATMERGSGKMTVQVVLYADYPCTAPVVAVSVHRGSETRSRLSDSHLMDMEAEVNIHFAELMQKKSDDQLLTGQVQRLLMCLDVYLETLSSDSSMEGPMEFAREKVLPRVARGPHRATPYCYNSQLGFFTHR